MQKNALILEICLNHVLVLYSVQDIENSNNQMLDIKVFVYMQEYTESWPYQTTMEGVSLHNRVQSLTSRIISAAKNTGLTANLSIQIPDDALIGPINKAINLVGYKIESGDDEVKKQIRLAIGRELFKFQNN